MAKPAHHVPRLTRILALPLLLALAAAWVRFGAGDLAIVTARVTTDLPDQAGAWSGDAFHYCQNEACRRVEVAPPDPPPAACPACGGELSPTSIGEKRALPADTRIGRRLYTAPNRPSYTVTIVQAGADHRSIHRPQECLPGQGVSILQQQVEQLRLRHGRTLDIMVLTASPEHNRRATFGFAYWFVGPDQETPSYFARHFWTTYDRLIRNTASRWAYVAVLIGEPLDSPESFARLTDFLDTLLPLIEKPGTAQPEGRP